MENNGCGVLSKGGGDSEGATNEEHREELLRSLEETLKIAAASEKAEGRRRNEGVACAALLSLLDIAQDGIQREKPWKSQKSV